MAQPKFVSCKVYTVRASTLGVGLAVTYVPADETVIADIPVLTDDNGKPLTNADGSPKLKLGSNLKLLEIMPAEAVSDNDKPEGLPDGAIDAGGFYLVPDGKGAYHRWEPGVGGGADASGSPSDLSHDPIVLAATGIGPGLEGAGTWEAPMTQPGGPLDPAKQVGNDPGAGAGGPLADADTTRTTALGGPDFSSMTRAQAEAHILDNGGDKPAASLNVAEVRELARAQKPKG